MGGVTAVRYYGWQRSHLTDYKLIIRGGIK
jgi:hypothetical protein